MVSVSSVFRHRYLPSTPSPCRLIAINLTLPSGIKWRREPAARTRRTPAAHPRASENPYNHRPMIRSVTLRRLAILPAFLLSAGAPAVHAQTAAPAAVEARAAVHPSLAGIDSMLTALYPAAEPGAAILVARDGQVLMRKAYGAASVELGVPLRPEHVFRLGSITKQFTAVAVLMLADEGRVSLDDEVTRFFPDYPTHGRRITVEHLLTHTSGIQSYTEMAAYVAGMRRDLTPEQLIAMFRDQPMEFAPGERWSYNNSGYALLGGIIEKVSGMSYGDFIRTRIFDPLGMRNSWYETANAIIPGRVSGYDREPEGLRVANYLSMTQPYAAGSLISTVDDQLVWQRAVAEGRMLKPETWRRAFSAYRLSDGRSAGYGYGWFVGEAAGKPSIEHGGDINGFSSNGLWIPSERLHVIVLSNRGREGERNPDDISRRIAETAPKVDAVLEGRVRRSGERLQPVDAGRRPDHQPAGCRRRAGSAGPLRAGRRRRTPCCAARRPCWRVPRCGRVRPPWPPSRKLSNRTESSTFSRKYPSLNELIGRIVLRSPPMMVRVVKLISPLVLTCSHQTRPQPWPSRLVTTSASPSPSRSEKDSGGRFTMPLPSSQSPALAT